MPHKPGFIHSGKDENSWNYFELPFGSGADYVQPIPVENLPYTPVELGDMLETGEKEKEIEVEGYGKGRLVISKQNKNKPFFYADEANIPANQKAAKQLQIAETGANLPLLTSPLTTLATGVPRIIKDKTRAQIKKARMGADETFKDNAINLKKTIDGVFQMSSNMYRRAKDVAKKSHISFKSAMDYVNLTEKGTPPSGPMKPGNITGITNKGLLKDTDVDDPTVYIPPEERPDNEFFSMNVDPADVPRNDLSIIRTPGKQGKIINEKFTQLGGIKGGRLNLKTYRQFGKNREFAEIFLTPYGKGVPFQADAKDKSSVIKAIFADTSDALGIPFKAGIQAHHKTPIKTILPSLEGVVYDSPKYHKFTQLYLDQMLALGNMPENIMSVLGHAGRDSDSPHYLVHAFMRATFGEAGEYFWTPEKLQEITVYDTEGNAIGTKNDKLRVKYIKQQVKNIKESIDILNVAQEHYEMISGGKNPVPATAEQIVEFFFNKVPANKKFTPKIIKNIVNEIHSQLSTVPQYDQLTMETIVDEMSLDAIDTFIKSEENQAIAEDMLLDVIFEGLTTRQAIRKYKGAQYGIRQLSIRFKEAINQAQKAPVITRLKDLYKKNREKEPPSIGSQWDMFDKDE